jgi:hypothetical protein
LGGDQEFAGEAGFGGAAIQGFFGGDADQVGVVVFLGDMAEDEVAGDGIESGFGVGEIFAYGVIGKVSGAGEDALLDDPGIWADFEHVEIVIGLEHEAIGIPEMDFDEFGHVAEVGDESHFCAVGAKGEADGIGGVMGNLKSVDVNIADGEVLAGMNGFDAIESFAERVGEDAVEGVKGRLGDVERSFPEAEHLREAIAVVGVFVGDEDAVEGVDGEVDGGEAGESFAFAEAAVYKEASSLGLEQGDVARAARRQDGNPQADDSLSLVSDESS